MCHRVLDCLQQWPQVHGEVRVRKHDCYFLLLILSAFTFFWGGLSEPELVWIISNLSGSLFQMLSQSPLESKALLSRKVLWQRFTLVCYCLYKEADSSDSSLLSNFLLLLIVPMT